ncbi:MAG TPA: hypothetical protein PKE04_19260, partial [Clostridia bacterium]|nr:hypothetical protein [Clostridia bacterium]
IEGTHFEIVNNVVTKKEGSNWGEIGHVWFYQFTGRPDEFEYLRIRFPDQEPVIAFAASQPRMRDHYQLTRPWL